MNISSPSLLLPVNYYQGLPQSTIQQLHEQLLNRCSTPTNNYFKFAVFPLSFNLIFRIFPFFAVKCFFNK